MAISKAEASVLTPDIVELVHYCEGIIDKKLANWTGGYRIISRADLGLTKLDWGTYEVLVKEIVRLYTDPSKGWTVKPESDQREGQWFRFS